jgi:hypothetical protein
MKTTIPSESHHCLNSGYSFKRFQNRAAVIMNESINEQVINRKLFIYQ